MLMDRLSREYASAEEAALSAAAYAPLWLPGADMRAFGELSSHGRD